MASKPFWDKPSPKKKSTPLTSAQKAAAKARAQKAGRPYPNLVDNAAAGKRSGPIKKEPSKKSTPSRKGK